MRAAVVGVTGYSGTELFRILSNHPEIEEINLYAREKEGVSKRFLNKEVSAFRNIENELLPYDAKKSWNETTWCSLQFRQGLRASLQLLLSKMIFPSSIFRAISD